MLGPQSLLHTNTHPPCLAGPHQGTHPYTLPYNLPYNTHPSPNHGPDAKPHRSADAAVDALTANTLSHFHSLTATDSRTHGPTASHAGPQPWRTDPDPAAPPQIRCFPRRGAGPRPRLPVCR